MTLICKRFYALTLFRKLGTTFSQSTNTNEHYKNINHYTLLKKHSDDFLRNFVISVSEDNKPLQSIYCIPKLHENPTKVRFIIAAPTCSLRKLSKYVTCASKLVFNNVNSYCKQPSFFSGVVFWN